MLSSKTISERDHQRFPLKRTCKPRKISTRSSYKRITTINIKNTKYDVMYASIGNPKQHWDHHQIGKVQVEYQEAFACSSHCSKA